MSPKSILIVEDETDIRDILSTILGKEGYPILQAENGLVALERLRGLKPEERPGMIILDLMMPVMNGRRFLEILNQDHPDDLAKIPVLVITAVAEFERIEYLPKSIEKMRKPFDLLRLLSIARGHCKA